MPETLSPYRHPGSLTRLSDVINELFRESVVFPRLLFEPPGNGFTHINSDLYETDDAYVVQMALPGIDPKKIEIRVVGHQMTIKGAYEIPPVPKATTIRRGLTAGEFSEVVTVPADVEGEKAEATYKNGILTVTLPKEEKVKPKSIKVQVTE